MQLLNNPFCGLSYSVKGSILLFFNLVLFIFQNKKAMDLSHRYLISQSRVFGVGLIHTVGFVFINSYHQTATVVKKLHCFHVNKDVQLEIHKMT